MARQSAGVEFGFFPRAHHAHVHHPWPVLCVPDDAAPWAPWAAGPYSALCPGTNPIVPLSASAPSRPCMGSMGRIWGALTIATSYELPSRTSRPVYTTHLARSVHTSDSPGPDGCSTQACYALQPSDQSPGAGFYHLGVKARALAEFLQPARCPGPGRTAGGARALGGHRGRRGRSMQARHPTDLCTSSTDREPSQLAGPLPARPPSPGAPSGARARRQKRWWPPKSSYVSRYVSREEGCRSVHA